VLGLVRREPRHGYALWDEVRRWPLDPSLIPKQNAVYKDLASLRNDGLIECAEAHPGSGRKPYMVTADGERAFEAWLRGPASTREDLLLRLVAANSDDLPLLIEVVRAAEMECRDALMRMAPYNTATLFERDVPEAVFALALVAKIEGAELAARLTALAEVGRTLRMAHERRVGRS
jgi:DNA-binding PadR family transcriptional regulator